MEQTTIPTNICISCGKPLTKERYKWLEGEICRPCNQDMEILASDMGAVDDYVKEWKIQGKKNTRYF